MTFEETKKVVSLMQAWLDGKTIQSFDRIDQAWYDDPEPGWNFSYCEYRIKPEPQCIPFQSAEEVLEAIKEHGDWVKRQNNLLLCLKIVAFSEKELILGDDSHCPLVRASDECIFADGTPFGKIVEG